MEIAISVGIRTSVNEIDDGHFSSSFVFTTSVVGVFERSIVRHEGECKNVFRLAKVILRTHKLVGFLVLDVCCFNLSYERLHFIGDVVNRIYVIS